MEAVNMANPSSFVLRMQGLPRFCLVFALLLLVCASPRAVEMVPLSLGQLTSTADWVVHGRVESKSCFRDTKGRITTRIVLAVLDTLKGTSPGAEIVIAQAGGTLGDTRVILDGQPDLAPGEELVVFLQRNERGEGVILGLAQGKFEVFSDGPAEIRYVRNLFLGRNGARSQARLAASDPQLDSIRLDDLKAFVRGGQR